LSFNVGDNNNVVVSSSVPILTSASPLQFLQLTRLNSTFAVLLYRDPKNGWQLSASLIDNSGAFYPTVLPPMVIHPGSTKPFGLQSFTAAVAPDRLALVYTDAVGQPWVYDVGVSSGSLVLGRCVSVLLRPQHVCN
jgi:hypothetical protein